MKRRPLEETPQTRSELLALMRRGAELVVKDPGAPGELKEFADKILATIERAEQLEEP